ncbi:MAG: autotransporter domain-containing protein [Bradyrhizobium sp.]
MWEFRTDRDGCRGHSERRIAIGTLSALAFAIVLLAGPPAFAACVPQAVSNITATCTGTTDNQGGGAPGTSAGTNGYGTGVETGITVNVAAGPGTTVTGTSGGLLMGDGAVTNNAGASITGGQSGIVATTGAITVTNSGGITGTSLSFWGIFANTNATVLNNAGASITGGIGILANTGVATVSNSGSIAGTNSFGIASATNTTVTNEAGASITGGTSAIGAGSAANVTNSGTIAGLGFGVASVNNVTVTNNAGGSITGGTDGIFAQFGAAAVTNSGSIVGTSSEGIFAGTNATVTNNAGGSITGGAIGIVAATGAAAVTNSGSITGGAIGILAHAGGSSVFNAGIISGGTAAIQFAGSGNTLTLAPGSAISGNVLGTGSDTFQLGGSGAATFDVSQLGPAAQYQGFGTFNKIDSSTWTLTGTSTFTGPVNVNGGTLSVNGDISSASSLTVNAGGTLGGNGIVGKTTINGGTLSPGNSIGLLTVKDNLVFTAASTYLVEVSSSSADRTSVTGTATLGGASVSAVPVGGTLSSQRYTILNASGGVIGAFNPVVTTPLPDLSGSLSYDANDVYLNFALNFGSGLNVNQQNVANVLTNFFNTTGSIPLAFASLTPAGLTQVSGETATGIQQTTFDAMNLFMGVLTDPFMARNGAPGSARGVPGFAEEDDVSAYAARKRNDTSAMFTKVPPQSFEQRWSVWAAGFGGSQTTNGNAALGSNDTTSRIAAGAVGADYLVSPSTLAGFALAGGGTNFSVANGGTGRSDLLQAGAYVRHSNGPSYISAALAYGWQDVTTDRFVTVAGLDHLRAEFNANAYSGRVEGGYRFVVPITGGIGLTPYAAAQFTTFDLPAYAEQVVSGAAAFALGYAAKSVTDTRSELGLRTDKSFAMTDGVLTLRSRVAWAYDFNPDRSIAATFQTLPGASFVVNGAAQAPDAALATASAEWKWINGWSVAASFEGEFSDVTSSYAGKGVVRYQW